MPASFNISSSTGSYQVKVASGAFADWARDQPHDCILADHFFASVSTLAKDGSSEPFWINATEAEKSLDRLPGLIEEMRGRGISREHHLWAIGGGITQDIAAFVSSVYMRGLPWSYVPTTVLAMVDSCIGGKSSINVGSFKNLIGTFHPPQQIIVDPTTAFTLPPDQLASGLIEAAKICFCRNEDSFQRYLACCPSPTMSHDAFEQVVINSLLAKKHFIEVDEFDKGDRLLLNFGHTFGHAIEGASHYAIPHGIAVGLGILCSLILQEQRGVSFSKAPRVEMLKRHLVSMVESMPDLRVRLEELNIQEILERFQSDKKHSSKHYTLILVAPNGLVFRESFERAPSVLQSIGRSIETMIRRLVA